MTTFLTLYTPTFRRPAGLAACMASVQAQTVLERIEHVIIPDYVGIGIAGMFARIPLYASAVHGQYVHVLGDDDVLSAPDVVERVELFATQHDCPPIIVVRVKKGDWDLPIGQCWPPVYCQIDLGCLVTRADVWQQHVNDYGRSYEGDYVFASTLARAGYPAATCGVHFVTGRIGHGLPETERQGAFH